MKNLTYIVLLFLFPVLTHAQEINTNESEVRFEISNMAVNTVEGTFRGMKGEITFNEKKLDNSTFEVCVDASTVDTDNKKRDTHLKNPDFFEVEKYPTICFKSKSIKKTDDGYATTGDLSLHGVTKEVEIPFTFDGKTFEGELEIKRKDYKIGEDTSSFTVGDDVEMEIICTVK